jgi:hypothetical protein
MAARTSGIASPVAVRLQAGGSDRVSAPTRRARSSSSMTCWVPILVAFRRPDLIQRRTVSGSRLVRRAAWGTVNIVARYYNNYTSLVRHPVAHPRDSQYRQLRPPAPRAVRQQETRQERAALGKTGTTTPGSKDWECIRSLGRLDGNLLRQLRREHRRRAG